MSKALTKKIYNVHQFVGVISGLILFVIGLSGSILVFREEIDHFQLQPPTVNYSKINIDQSVKTLAAKYPDAEIRLTNVSPQKEEALCFSVRKAKERLTIYTHPETAAILKTVDTNSTLIFWTLNLHYNLHAGQTGKTIVFITGILFTISIITGLIIYRKSILKVLSFNVKLNNKNNHTLSSSLHRTVGVWSLLLNLILAFTGVVISFSIVSSGFKKQEKPVHSKNELSISCNVDSVLNQVKAQYPGYQPNFIRIQAGSETMQIGGSFTDDFFLYLPSVNRIKIDLASGNAKGKLERIADKTAGEKFNELVKPLHFGEYGGFTVKIIYCLSGLSIPLLSITGFALWYSRKRREMRIAM